MSTAKVALEWALLCVGSEARFATFTKLVDISSTDIREAVRQGVTDDELKRLVPPQVADYIIKMGLYQ